VQVSIPVSLIVRASYTYCRNRQHMLCQYRELFSDQQVTIFDRSVGANFP
jgi:hypothetical protein